MAGVDVVITVEDIATKLLTYESIQLERATSAGGSFSLVETENLVAGQYHYTINNADGTLNHWYRYRFHHSTGPVDSDYSNPFRVDGVTRLRTRQAAIKTYGAGVVLVNTGMGTATVITSDHRILGSIYRAGKGKGTWLHPTGGNNAGKVRVVTNSDPTTGTFNVDSWGAAMASGDEVEWHWLAAPDVWDDAVIRAAKRYFYVDRVPIKGVADQDEYDLSSIPWLLSKEHVHDVRYYPDETSSGVDGIDRSWGSDGRWWRTRDDNGVITLQIAPTIDAATTLYLEISRQMPPLHTDTAAAPVGCSEELLAALTFDEVMAYLSNPPTGSLEERRAWRARRKEFAPELHRLLVKHRPRPRLAPARNPYPVPSVQPFKAR